ncbi:integral membrane protein [Colletotrichum kahawae]|uniref:Integral membrane protein n=1 Tax=Colletotrichum kahawae TaxID=34407 RepID=A0AAD9YR57_COLKA|nr:integral membrane protein [Colletotrichum kahawae]
MEDRSGQVLAVAVLFFVLCWSVVGLRIYCRGWIIRSFGVDDKLMIGLMLLFTVYLIMQIQGVRYGTGRHGADLTAEANRDALMYWYICELLYIISTCLLKISVGYFLLRVSIRRSHVWILRVLMLGTVLFGTTYFFMVTFQCVPVNTFWEESPRVQGKCFNDRVVVIMTLTASIINCLADWSFGILPLFIVWSLSLPKRTRLLAFAILSFAAIGSAATVVRSVYIPTLLNGDDFLWATTDVALWSTVEPGIGITAASLATLRPLWQLVWYRAGLKSQAPRAVAWRERLQGKPSYVRSDESGGRPRQARFRLSDVDAPLEEIEAGIQAEIQAEFDAAELPRIHHPGDDAATSSAPSRRSGLSKTFDLSYPRKRSGEEDGEGLVTPREDGAGGHYLAPTPTRETHEAPSDLEDGLHLSPMVPSTAPTLNWVSPRMSALSMGFTPPGNNNPNPNNARDSMQSSTTWGGFNNNDPRASRVSSLTTATTGVAVTNTYTGRDSVSHIDTYRDSRTTARNSRYDRYSRATRTSSYHSRFLAPPSPGDVPLPSPPPPVWQVNVPGGMDSAQWLSSRMTDHPGNPGGRI